MYHAGRWDTLGAEMFKLKDRHARDYCLGPVSYRMQFTTPVRN